MKAATFLVLALLNVAVVFAQLRKPAGRTTSGGEDVSRWVLPKGDGGRYASFDGLSLADVQVFSSVRGDAEIDALVSAWGHFFPRFHFVVSDPNLAVLASAAPRSGSTHTVVTTRSVNAGIRQSLAVKLWRYLVWACDAAAERNATTPEATRWMLRVDADTFVLLPRLMRVLAAHDADKPMILAYVWDGAPIGNGMGHRRWPSGGAGVAISHAGFARMCPHVYAASEARAKEILYDDVMLGVFATDGGVDLRHMQEVFWWKPPTEALGVNEKTVATLHDIDSTAVLKQLGAVVYDVFGLLGIDSPSEKT